MSSGDQSLVESAKQKKDTLFCFMFNLAILNESTVYTLPANLLSALQTQVSDHFAPEWGVDAKLRLITKSTDKQPGEWLLAILDDSDQAGALGYHELSSDGMPLGKVFAKTTTEAGLSVTVTISHELLEMLADEDINLSCEIDNANGLAAQMYAREVCDAVEDDQYGYQINGILVSDFVRRHWFIPGEAGPYDYQNKVTAPLQLLSGGYIGVMDVTTQGWQQVDAEANPEKPNIRSLGRLEKRNKPREQWRHSER